MHTGAKNKAANTNRTAPGNSRMVGFEW
jgi:hypothetical protein